MAATYGGGVNALTDQMLQSSMVRLLLWYGNETDFTNQLLRLVRMLARGC